jgi:hypothetical protein
MEFEIEFRNAADEVGVDVEIALSGTATPELFYELVETLGRDPRYRAGLRMLVDVSAFDVTSLTDEQLEGVAEQALERDWFHPPAAVAIVAPGKRLGAAARAYRAHLGGSRSNRQVFDTRDEAVAWLAAQAAVRGDGRPTT